MPEAEITEYIMLGHPDEPGGLASRDRKYAEAWFAEHSPQHPVYVLEQVKTRTVILDAR